MLATGFWEGLAPFCRSTLRGYCEPIRGCKDNFSSRGENRTRCGRVMKPTCTRSISRHQNFSVLSGLFHRNASQRSSRLFCDLLDGDRVRSPHDADIAIRGIGRSAQLKTSSRKVGRNSSFTFQSVSRWSQDYCRVARLPFRNRSRSLCAIRRLQNQFKKSAGSRRDREVRMLTGGIRNDIRFT